MNEFLENLKREATANPTAALGIATVLIAASAKLIDAMGHAKGSNAYAKQVRHSIKKSKHR